MPSHPSLIKRISRLLFAPRSRNEDDARKESILNILLLASTILSLAGFAFALQDYLHFQAEYMGVSPWLLLGITLFFTTLLTLSRFRYYKVSAYILISLYFLAGTLTMTLWGITLASSWFVYILVTLMTAVIISTRASWFVLIVAIATAAGVTYLQETGVVTPDYYWVTAQGSYDDLLTYGIMFAVIVVVFGLSNREIERSLQRARRSEEALKKERDSLEETVAHRTQELVETQRTELLRLYRFAELGRTASSLIHDLINPLTSASLNLKQLPKQRQGELTKRALTSVESMERFIESARKQIQQQQKRTLFQPDQEIELAVHVLTAQAKKHRVEFHLDLDSSIQTYGDPIKFHKLALNILSNAIDAFQGYTPPYHSAGVNVRLLKKGKQLLFSVQDNGQGISPENLEHVFQPFFTTKEESSGLGMGLAIVKELVEDDFNGQISIKSKPEAGTTVSVTFPHAKG